MFGFGRGTYNNFDNNFQIDDQIIGYTATRDLSCEDLSMDGVQYESTTCSGASRNGFISWTGPGSAFELQEKVGANWQTRYNGANDYAPFVRTGGSYQLRIRGTTNGEYGDWRNFTAGVPQCSTGGGGTQPR